MARFTRLIGGAGVLAVAAAAALPLTGCGTVGGTTMMTYNRGQTPPGLDTVEEENEGWWNLMPSNSGNPLRRIKLEEGDRYGFEERDGEIAGLIVRDGEEKTIPLEARLATSYYWKFDGKAKKE